MSPRRVMRLCCDVSDQQHRTIEIGHSVRGALLVAGCSFVGGVFGGPPGIAIGGAVWGLLGYWAGASDNQPLSEALMKLSPSKQMELVIAILRRLGHWTVVAPVVACVQVDARLRQPVAEVLVNYGSKVLKGKVCYGG